MAEKGMSRRKHALAPYKAEEKRKSCHERDTHSNVLKVRGGKHRRMKPGLVAMGLNAAMGA